MLVASSTAIVFSSFTFTVAMLPEPLAEDVERDETCVAMIEGYLTKGRIATLLALPKLDAYFSNLWPDSSKV